MIRLTFAGCGAVTEEEHLPALRGLPGVQMVGAADPRPEHLHLVCDRFGMPPPLRTRGRARRGSRGRRGRRLHPRGPALASGVDAADRGQARARREAARPRPREFEEIFKTSYRTQWEHVLDAIRTDGPVGCTPEEGRPAFQTALAAVESAATGRLVRAHVAARRSA